MGCPSVVEIGNNLVFSVNTHSPSTGSAKDADAVPAYQVYEDETDAPILSGTMSKRNSKTGFYTELIACTIGNGFEAGKTYTIEVEATVEAIDATCSFGFKPIISSADIVAATLAGIIEGSITLKHALQAILAFAAGKCNGGGTATLNFRDQADGKNRIVLTVDADGNRSASTLNFD